MINKDIKYLLIGLLLLLNSNCALAQPDASSDEVQVASEGEQKLESLIAINQSLRSMEKDLAAKKKLLPKADSGRTKELEQEITRIAKDIEVLNRNFEEIASGTDLSSFRANDESLGFSWQAELTELLKPLVQEVKELTNTPREISKLENRIDQYSKKVRSLAGAIQNIEKLAELSNYQSLKDRLLEIRNQWTTRLSSLSTELSVAQQKLNLKLTGRKSLSETVEELFQLFFKKRAVNLFLAFFSALVFWLGARRMQLLVNKFSSRFRYRRAFITRVLGVISLVAAGVGSALTFIIVLYFRGDWLLLILAALLILGLVWGSKKALPQYWGQLMLLLNMGPVRQDERILWKGLPWRIESLNLFTILRNPLLAGGIVKLPLNDLFDLRSRPCTPEEPWFPTKSGDWVELEDGELACVTIQSIDSVVVTQLGGASRCYPSVDWYSMKFKNLSQGFRISSRFGLDYGLQAEITEKIPDTIAQELRSNLLSDGTRFINLRVEFEQAAASSIDIVVIVDFPGELAGRYQALNRRIAKICVEVATSKGWNIPFPQITLSYRQSDSSKQIENS